MKPLKIKIVRIPNKIPLIKKSEEVMQYLYDRFYIIQKNVWLIRSKIRGGLEDEISKIAYNENKT